MLLMLLCDRSIYIDGKWVVNRWYFIIIIFIFIFASH